MFKAKRLWPLLLLPVLYLLFFAFPTNTSLPISALSTRTLTEQKNWPKNERDWNLLRKQEFMDMIAYYKEHELDFGKSLSNRKVYQLIPSTFQCDLNRFTRIGNSLDGGKWLCSEYFHPSKKCTIFSLGSRGDFSFELAILQKAKHCQVHTFDCTGEWPTPPNVHFHPWCLSGKDFVNDKGWVYKTWQSIMKELDLKSVEYLKMDITGGEWAVFPALLEAPDEYLPTQISFELHFYPDSEERPRAKGINPIYLPETYGGHWFLPALKLFELMYQRGYHIAAQEYNEVSIAECCSEFVMVRPGY